MRIALIGHLCIDHNSSESATYTSWGSGLMYMAHYFQDYRDISPDIIAPYGTDFIPYAGGVSLALPPVGDQTLQYQNLMRGSRRTWRCEGVSAANPVPLTAAIRSIVAEADIICVAPLLPNYPAAYLQELLAGRKQGSITALSAQGYLRTIDPAGNVLPQEFTDASGILPLFDLVILSDDDLPDALTTARGWADRLDSTHIIVTQGSRGASIVATDSITAVPADAVPAADIVDSVGCGDVFTAAAMHTYAAKHDILQAVTAGNSSARAKLFQSSMKSDPTYTPGLSDAAMSDAV